MVFILFGAVCFWVVLLGFVLVLCHATKHADEDVSARPYDRRVRNLAVALERRIGV